MNRTLKWAVAATIVGAGCGVALGFWEARPWTLRLGEMPIDATPAAGALPTQHQQAKAVIPETVFHFGNMESGATQSHSFPIRNAGGGPLTVTFVSHTCKCTTVELDGHSVEPNDSITIPPGGEKAAFLEWAAKVPAGPFRHGASFTTNDPDMTRVELTVEGEIVESTTLSPSVLSFHDVRVAEQAHAELLVLAFLEPEVEILSHEVRDEKLAAKVSIAVEPVTREDLPLKAQAGARLIATFNPGGDVGPFAGSVRLTTNLKHAPTLEVPIYGRVKGDISVFGKGWSEANGLLRMDPISSKAGGAANLMLMIRGEQAAATELKVERVEPPELQAELGERQPMRDDLIRQPLVVSIPAGTKPLVRAGEDQGGEGEIILSTTHPTTKQVRLRVLLTVKP